MNLTVQPPRSSFSCDRHPTENFSGFCPECLCERLTTLNPSTTIATSSSSNTTSASIKSFFRRTKSFSAAKNEHFLSSFAFEPQRKSCDVRHTLSSLFQSETLITTNNNSNNNTEDEIINLNVDDSISNIVDEITEIERELDEDIVSDNEVKIMKGNNVSVDLDSESKNKAKTSGLWSAASVLSQKWRKWRRKGKKGNVDVLAVEKGGKKSKYRETQSEIADYGFGRRSCDVEPPRFSLDVGRMSFDDARYSLDEPRASWDGYMIGRSFPRLPPMVEDVPVVPVAVPVVPRADMFVSVQQQEVDGNEEFVPGGSVQTREYYTDSSSKRRKSLDRSNSIRKMAAAVVAEMDDAKMNTTNVGSNAKVSPATIDCSYGGLRSLSVGGGRELGRDSNSNSLRDDCSDTFELRLRDNVGDKKEGKKPRRWRWKLWGFIQRRGGNKDDEEDDGFSRVNGVDRSYSGSWGQNGIDKKVFRSNSSVSWRNSSYKSTSEINRFGNGQNRRVGGDEFVLERNRSARYSPSHTDSGLLRFYLTPLRGSRRSRPISIPNNSIARNMLRL